MGAEDPNLGGGGEASYQLSNLPIHMFLCSSPTVTLTGSLGDLNHAITGGVKHSEGDSPATPGMALHR